MGGRKLGNIQKKRKRENEKQRGRERWGKGIIGGTGQRKLSSDWGGKMARR